MISNNVLIVGEVISFKHGDETKYGVIDLVNDDTVWVNQVAHKGGYVSQKTDIIHCYRCSEKKFRDDYPELLI